MSLLLAYTFNEQSATPCDYSGNKNTGTSANLTFVAGENYGYAASYASNSYVKATPSNFAGISLFTFFAHIKITALPGTPGSAYIVKGDFLIYIDSSGALNFTSADGTKGGSSSSVISTGWHTIGCVWDGSKMYLYIDGIQDTNNYTLTSYTFTNNAIYIGNDSASDTSNTLNGYIDSVEFRSSALTADDMITLHNSPGGLSITDTPHNFATGDLIADSTLTYKGVVTWVSDAQTFYFYPVTPVWSGYGKIGNIYQSARQRYMEFINDFDSNGNGQISVKEPIACWADYYAPVTQYTFDYRGLSGNGMGGSFQWFSEYQERYNTGSDLTSFYQETLVPGMLAADGSYFTFNYTVNVVNNANAKTMYVKFANQHLADITATTGALYTYKITGKLKMLNKSVKTAWYEVIVQKFSTSLLTTEIYTGTLADIDFAVNNKLLLQGQGSADNDILAISGNGEIKNIIPL